MAVRRINVVKHSERTNNLNPRSIHWHENLRLLEVLGCCWVCFDHTDHDLTAGITGATSPVLFAVDYPLVALEHSRSTDVSGIRRGYIRLGHPEARADFAVHQRLEPLLFLRFCAVLVDDFHVAGIGRTAVKDLSTDIRATHLFCEVSVLNRI